MSVSALQKFRQPLAYMLSDCGISMDVHAELDSGSGQNLGEMHLAMRTKESLLFNHLLSDHQSSVLVISSLSRSGRACQLTSVSCVRVWHHDQAGGGEAQRGLFWGRERFNATG